MSTSREISPAQPASAVGSGEAAPFWFTLRKQPLAVVHAGSPYVDRYVARSDSAFGSSWASTIATVWPAPAVELGSLYALCRSAGPRPAGSALGWTALALASVRTSASQWAKPLATAVEQAWE